MAGKRLKGLATLLAALLIAACVLAPGIAFADEVDAQEEAAVEESLLPEEGAAEEIELSEEEEVAPQAAADSEKVIKMGYVIVTANDVPFNGREQSPVSVKYLSTTGWVELENGIDYYVSYRSTLDGGYNASPARTLRNACSYEVLGIFGMGEYSGSIRYNSDRPKGEIKSANWNSVAMNVADQEWTGRNIVPAYTLSIDGNELIEGQDFTRYSISNNRSVGDASIVFETLPAMSTGRYPSVWAGGTNVGKYASQKLYSFRIVGNLKDATIEAVPDQDYTGSAIKPSIKIAHPGKAGSNKTLVEGTDYKLSYKNNVEAGTATITVTGIGYYTGTSKTTFTIVRSQEVWKRLAGKNGLLTMREISREGFSQQGGYVVIVTDASFKDALSAASLAGRYGAPILMTPKGSLSGVTRSELQRLKPAHAIIVGGTGAVSAEVEAQIKALVADVKRIGGKNAMDTSRIIAARMGQSDTVIVATSKDFPDALSIAPWSYAYQAPILLTDAKGQLSAASLERITESCGASRAVIVGGTQAVNASSERMLKQAGLAVVRLAGDTAVETSEKIALWELKNGFSLANVAVATRTSFKDALSGAALMGGCKGPIILVNGSNWSAVNNILKGKAAQVSQGYFLGGTAVVSAKVASAVEAVK